MVCCCILQYEYAGEPDEEGNPTTRPGKVGHIERYNCCDVNDGSLFSYQLSDRFPEPYPNEEAARFANTGKLTSTQPHARLSSQRAWGRG